MVAKNLSERTSFQIRIFADEYAKVSVNGNMSLGEAQTQIRAKLDLPARQKQGSPKTAVRKLLKDASEEQIAKALELLKAE